MSALQNQGELNPSNPAKRRRLIERCCIILFIGVLGLIIYWVTVSILS